MDILQEISRYLQSGEDKQVLALTEQALDLNLSPGRILQDGLIRGMAVVGDQFKNHEIFLPDVLLAAKAMTGAMERLKPLLIGDETPLLGKVVIGTVRGDLHDIGKNLVGIMLRGAGFDVIDLGRDVPPEKFVATAAAEKAQVVGMSALLTTTMPVMKQVVDMLRAEGLTHVRTVIGGAPVSAEYAREIGADDYGYDAGSAVEKIRQLVED
ncbi:MAG: corrinoid protein [Acidobacteria bacterium]|nr:corrinoid protein [Acidobacteriota bacterium]